MSNYSWPHQFISNILIICILLSLVYDPFCSAVLFAQTRADDLLQEGVNAYESVDFQKAAESLNRALVMGIQKKEQLAQAFQYLAFAYAALGNTEESKKIYIELLALNPDFKLPLTASPRLREPLLVARKTLAAQDHTPPEIILQTVDAVIFNMPLTIKVKAIDGSGIDRVDLYYRSPAQNTYESLPMQFEADQLYRAFIPVEKVDPPGIQYYIEAFDANGNGPSRQGSETSPLYIEVMNPDERIAQSGKTNINDEPAKEKIYKESTTVMALNEKKKYPQIKKRNSKTWLWISLGALVIGGGVTAVSMGGGESNETIDINNSLIEPPDFPSN